MYNYGVNCYVNISTLCDILDFMKTCSLFMGLGRPNAMDMLSFGFSLKKKKKISLVPGPHIGSGRDSY